MVNPLRPIRAGCTSLQDGALEPRFFSNPGLAVSADIAVNIHEGKIKGVDLTVTNAEMTGDGWSVRLWTELISLPTSPGDKIIVHGEARIDEVGRGCGACVCIHIYLDDDPTTLCYTSNKKKKQKKTAPILLLHLNRVHMNDKRRSRAWHA